MKNLFVLILAPLLIISIISKGQTNSSSKTRALDLRLAAEVYEDSIIQDSTVYTYSGFRGSNDAQFNLKYYSRYYFSDIDFDSKLIYRNNNGSLGLSQKCHRTYNGTGLEASAIDSSFFMNNWWKNSNTSYIYNATGQVEEEDRKAYNNNTQTWENNWRIIHAYAGNNQVNTIQLNWNQIANNWDSIGSWNRTFQNSNIVEQIYRYKQNGVWIEDDKQEFLYANGRISKESVSFWDTTTMSWTLTYERIYKYNSASQLDSLIVSGMPTGNQWFQMNYYHLEWTGNNITTFYTDLSNNLKGTIAYDADGNPITQTVLSKYSSNSYNYLPDHGFYKIRYYYESYNNNVGIKELGKLNNYLTIYPNPANDKLYIKLEENKVANIQIYDLNGRVLIKQESDLVQLDVSSLKTGTYLLQALDNKGQQYSKRFTKE